MPAWGQTAPRQAHFFIVENPRSLSIYNKYQQAITVKEGRLFRPFVPMEMVESRGFLSDNFTRCMIVNIGSETFYLLKDNAGMLENVDQAGYQAIFRNCTIRPDTVRVLESRIHTLSPRIDIAMAGTMLDKNTLVRRLFRKEQYDYVQMMGETITYGWVFFSPKRQKKSWEVVKRSAILATIPDDIQARIRSHMREVNSVLHDVFSHLNRESGQSHPIPQWNLDISKTHVTCSMNDSSYADRFSESIQYIINDLDSLVRSAGFTAKYEDGVIEIKRR